MSNLQITPSTRLLAATGQDAQNFEQVNSIFRVSNKPGILVWEFRPIRLRFSLFVPTPSRKPCCLHPGETTRRTFGIESGVFAEPSPHVLAIFRCSEDWWGTPNQINWNCCLDVRWKFASETAVLTSIPRKRPPKLPQKLIIDADPGVCDAFAILVALVDPSIDVVGMTATAGSVSGPKSCRNLQFLLELVDPLKHPRIGHCERPTLLEASEHSEHQTRHSLYGGGGLGDVQVEVPELHNRKESSRLIVELVNQSPHEITILCLGPLTNLAAACDLDPELPGLIQSVVCLGGADNAAGDITAAAEFNIWADPEAAAEVLELSTAATLVPLGVSAKPVLTFEDVDALLELVDKATNKLEISQMLQHALLANRQHLAFEGIPLHSVAALAVATKAERFSVKPVKADVETSGQLTRGMTVIDRRRSSNCQTNIDLVTSIDELGVVDYFSRGIRRAAR